MKIKRDDNVVIIAGKDKGKTGKVVKAFPKTSQIVISGVNVKKRHTKARQGGKKGEIIEKSAPIHVSNVMLIDSKTGKQTRTGRKEVNGKTVRITKKSESIM
jgi:large subunit ribosomal protein L24